MAIKANFTPLQAYSRKLETTSTTLSRPAATRQDKFWSSTAAISVEGGQPTVVNTTEIDVSGGNGNDTISLGNAGQALPSAHLFGGNGKDTLIGGAGNDTLDGGAGDDTVVGGKGTDTAFLGAGNDTFIWNPGDGNDVVEGGGGFDTLDFRGADRQLARRSHRSQRLRGDVQPSQRHHRSHRCRAHSVRGSGPALRQHHDQRSDRNRREAGRHRPGRRGRRRRRWSGGHGFHQRDQRPAIRVADNNGVVTVSGLASTVTIANFEEDTDQLFINHQIVAVTNGQSVTVAAVNSNNTAGSSTASEGSHAAALLGQFMASSFATAGDGHGATPVADQQPDQQPLLAQPHA